MLSCSRRSIALTKRSSRWASNQAQGIRSERPPIAPKQFPNLKDIKERPESYAANAEIRNYGAHKDSPRQVVELSKRIAAINHDLVSPRRDIKKLEKQLGEAHANQREADAVRILDSIRDLRAQVNRALEEQDSFTKEAGRLALALPNLTSTETPTNDEPTVLGYINYDPQQPPVPVEGADHSEIGQNLGILDFASAATTTGWGFYYLRDEAVLLEHALLAYATSVALKYGWRLVTPPSVVYSHIADSCGFQPRDINDEQQIWQIAQAERDAGKPRRSLAATAEIPIAALYADKSIREDTLPLKLVGSSRCYRAEAGARGVDTKGLYRVHEFTKVEMFAWTNAPESDDPSATSPVLHSTAVFDEMVKIQTEILTSLGLPCRVLEMPSSDLGASAFRKIDIEAFFPSRTGRDHGWGELTSVSICTDYQSRRLNTRIKDRSGTQSRFPHTVNGTAMAIPRVIACILENGWNPETQSVVIPRILRPFMGGAENIGPK